MKKINSFGDLLDKENVLLRKHTSSLPPKPYIPARFQDQKSSQPVHRIFSKPFGNINISCQELKLLLGAFFYKL
jgi:hypothetical protein